VTLIDTNVLLDLFTNDPVWAAWSIQQLDAAAARGALIINDVVYAELSVRFAAIEALDTALNEAGIMIAPTPRSALFLVGKVFQRYRAAGGVRTGVLPDFFIGAHAAVLGDTLLTRDLGRYRTYFPKLELIGPSV
jgi:predicted nucleic acid-binding protein